MSPRLFLAFEKHRDEFEEHEWYNAYLRCLMGPYKHCEIAYECDRIMVRVTVFAPDARHWDDRVFRTPSRYDNVEEWNFLQIPCTHDQLVAINDELKAQEQREDRYSALSMFKSGLPDAIPDFVARMFISHEFEPSDTTKVDGNTHCTKICLRALHAAGMLVNQPDDRTTASDLYILALEHLEAIPTSDPIPEVSAVDSAGFLKSQHTLMNELWGRLAGS